MKYDYYTQLPKYILSNINHICTFTNIDVMRPAHAWIYIERDS